MICLHHLHSYMSHIITSILPKKTKKNIDLLADESSQQTPGQIIRQTDTDVLERSIIELILTERHIHFELIFTVAQVLRHLFPKHATKYMAIPVTFVLQCTKHHFGNKRSKATLPFKKVSWSQSICYAQILIFQVNMPCRFTGYNYSLAICSVNEKLLLLANYLGAN